MAAELCARDQALLVAVHKGGRALWAEATTPDFFYLEEGDIQQREAFLAGLDPDGQGGLIIRDYRLVRLGDTALVLHHDLVPPDATDPRAAQVQLYVMTETWTRVAGVWKLHLVHVDAVKTPPPSVDLTTAQLDALTGTYRRGSAMLAVRRVDGHLVAKRQGRADIVLAAETRDVHFDPDELRARYIFQRDSEGKVVALIRRYENSDSVWVRSADEAMPHPMSATTPRQP